MIRQRIQRFNTNYKPSDFRKKKYMNKVKLQAELGLAVDKKKYMIGLISRLTDQKGLDLIDYVFERILDDNTQFVVIGTGEERYENMFRHFAWKYGDRVSANICYDSDLAQKLVCICRCVSDAVPVCNHVV